MNDNYDRAPAALEAEVSRGLTQSGFINRVFGWMTAGLALTGAISYGIAHSSMSKFVLANQGTYLLLILLELGVVIGLSAAINRLSATVATLGFLLFAVLNGLTLSWIFLAYEPSSIYATFFVTSGTFGGVGLFGWLTKRDLSGIGGLCGMALWGLILATIVNIFWTNSTVSLFISYAGVAIFVGLTAWDIQKIKQLSFAVEDGDVDTELGKSSRSSARWSSTSTSSTSSSIFCASSATVADRSIPTTSWGPGGLLRRDLFFKP